MQSLDAAIREDIENFDVGEIVELFTLDATPIGGAVYRFAPAPVDGAAPSFGGESYSVVPFESEGWEWTGTGPLPQPVLRFKMSRDDGDMLAVATVLLSLIEALEDLHGARVLRVQTLKKYLDGQPEADGQMSLGTEIYEIERKLEQTPEVLAFQLRSSLDHEDVTIPRRQAINHCQWRYRRAVSGGFDYENVTCPYTGPAMFDLEGNVVTDPAEDRCAKILPACELRFGENAKLPFGGFPGVGKIRL